MSDYLRRVVDGELDELLPELAAIVLEGPKGVGKTETARRRAQAIFQLDEPAQKAIAAADPAAILKRGRTCVAGRVAARAAGLGCGQAGGRPRSSAGPIDAEDVANLAWLRKQLGDQLLGAVVINTGPQAYRRKDGVAVIPASLLGP